VTHKEFGDRGEYLARLYLERKGYIFVRANYRTKFGEIDLILLENDEVVFTEVKTRTFRSAEAFGRAIYRVNREKQQRIIRTSRVFWREEPLLCKGMTPRYDTVELYMDSENDRKIHVIHTPCAFGL